MFKNSILPMKLQYFADPQGSGDAGTSGQASAGGSGSDSQQAQGSEASASGSETAGSLYTEAQLQKIVQERVARERNSAKSAAEEAEKLAKMSADERRKYQAEQKDDELAKATAELAKYKMNDTARRLLSDAKIAVTDDVLGLVVTDEADSTKANVDKLKKFAQSVTEAAKKEFLKGKAPLNNGGGLKNDKGALGARLAKSQVQSHAKPNPYFQDPFSSKK